MKILTDEQYQFAMIALNIAQMTSTRAFAELTALGLTADRKLFDDSNVHSVLDKYPMFEIWDYTGAIYPIIHLNKNSYNFKQW